MLQTIPTTEEIEPVLFQHNHAGELTWVTLATVDSKDWFRDQSLAHSTAHSLHHCLDNSNAQLLAWVLLPDQLHVMIQAGSNCNLADAMQRLKICTAIAVNKTAQASIGLVGPLWQSRYCLQPVHRREYARELAMSIIHQPQQLGLVEHYADYPYWDCIWV